MSVMPSWLVALHWGRPAALVLLLPALAVVWIRLRTHPAPSGTGLCLLHPDTHGALRAAQAAPRRNWRAWLQRSAPGLALACWTLALAQPELPGAWQRPAPLGRDVLVVLDTSLTMSLADMRWGNVPAQRLAVVKQVLDQFIAEANGDRFGLIAFGSRAATLLPPTFDRDLVRAMLQRVRVGVLGDDTALGDALGLALRQARPGAAGAPLILLYSDNGSSNAGRLSPAQALALARARGVRIVAIQVGDTPATGSAYTVSAYQGPQPDMRALGMGSGGRYIDATSFDAQQDALRAVRALAPVLQPAARRGPPRQLYPWPLSLGIALWLLGSAAGGFAPRIRSMH